MFGIVVLLLGVGVPAWALTEEGSEDASPENVPSNLQQGKDLFVTNCGACHTLAEAGTDGVIGPNLDDLLAPPSASAPDPNDDQAARPERDQQRRQRANAQGRRSRASRPTRSRPSSPRSPARVRSTYGAAPKPRNSAHNRVIRGDERNPRAAVSRRPLRKECC